jgi:HEAT repeat protein
MYVDKPIFKSFQPPLFDLGDSSTVVAEFFPQVWGMAEGLTKLEDKVRRESLEQIAELRVARVSPLVVYLLVTLVDDPNIDIRAQVVQVLGDVLSLDGEGKPAPDAVRHHMTSHLSKMRTRQIFALLQLLVRYDELEPQIARLLNACPYAGNHLADVVGSRKAPLDVRRKAVRLIGRVGYIDAIPSLERLLTRLETRINGQQALPFAPQIGNEEMDLIPELHSALFLLRSP